MVTHADDGSSPGACRRAADFDAVSALRRLMNKRSSLGNGAGGVLPPPIARPAYAQLPHPLAGARLMHGGEAKSRCKYRCLILGIWLLSLQPPACYFVAALEDYGAYR